MGLNHYQYHSELVLRCMVQKPDKQYSTIVLLLIQAPAEGFRSPWAEFRSSAIQTPETYDAADISMVEPSRGLGARGFRLTGNSKKLEYEPGMIYAGFPSSLGFGDGGTVTFQLSGAHCRPSRSSTGRRRHRRRRCYCCLTSSLASLSLLKKEEARGNAKEGQARPH